MAYLDSNGQAVVKAEYTEVATCWHHCVGSLEKEMRANARLISAAPDLLDALRECITLVQGEVPRKAIDAIAKATGAA